MQMKNRRMSDKKVITAIEIGVVEKIEETIEKNTMVDVQEEKHIVTTTNVVISIENEDITMDKDKKAPVLKKEKKKKKKLTRTRLNTSLNTILNSIEQDISYRKNIGCKGTFILCLNLFMIGLYVYGFQIYGGFTCRVNHCPATIFFFIFGLLNTLSFLYLILRWKVKIKNRIKRMSKSNYKSKHPFKNLLNMYYSRFGLHGKYYLYKLYGSEMLEKISQTYSFICIYTCILPYQYTMSFCVLYIIDSGILVKTIYKSLFGTSKIISAAERDLQLARDVIFDLICALTPFLLGQRLPVNINEIMFILFVPSMSLFGKIRSLFKEALFHNVDMLIIKLETKASASIKRHRRSIYRQAISEKEQIIQSKYFIKPVRQILLFIGVVHVLCFTCIFFVQLSHGINLEKHDKMCHELYHNDTNPKSYHNIWSNNNNADWFGCKIKTPFCKSVFVPTCNCAHLSLESINVPTLPDNIIYEMNSLKKLEVVNCNLTTLPKNMENLKFMASIDLSYNKLTEFNVDVKEWVYLNLLNFQFNNISKYNMDSLWQQSTLKYLYAKNNPNFEIPNEVNIHMPMLTFLDLRNNSIQLPNKFGKDQFPALKWLYLSGNNLNIFPDNIDTLNENLLYMYIARCHINTLPSYLSKFIRLKGFDARNNNISVVDPTFQSIFYDEKDSSKRNKRRALFSGNPVCRTDTNLKKSGSCKEMCSSYCQYKEKEKDESGNGYCDAECNSEKCNYDKGDCKGNLQCNYDKGEFTIKYDKGVCKPEK